MGNSTNNQELTREVVKETSPIAPKSINEPLFNHIKYESESSISKLAEKTEVNRQYISGILHRRIKCPIQFAQKIAKALNVKSIHTLFRQDDLYYPAFKSAYQISVATKLQGEPSPQKEGEASKDKNEADNS